MANVRLARCLMCKEVLEYTQQDTNSLLKHLVNKHPDVQIAPFEECEECKRGLAFSDGNLSYRSLERHKREARRRKYRTTLELWRPGESSVACPNCGVESPPVIRKTRTSQTTTPCGAACCVGCWPLCLLPMLLFGAHENQLFCSNCAYFLGSYDTRTCVCAPTDAKTEKVNQAYSAPNL